LILYSDSIVRLDYTPAQDIVLATLPVVRAYDVNEINQAFISMVGCITEYNITRLLLDFTGNTLELPEAEYKQSIAQLADGLLQTPLVKMARIRTQNDVREQKIKGTYEGIKNRVGIQVVFSTFYDKTEAIQWLSQP
jgi:hypothetical protein